LNEKSDHESDEESETSDGTKFSDELGEVVQLVLKGSVLGVSSEICAYES